MFLSYYKIQKEYLFFSIVFDSLRSIDCSIERKALVYEPVMLSVLIIAAIISTNGFSVTKKMAPEIDIITVYSNSVFFLPI